MCKEKIGALPLPDQKRYRNQNSHSSSSRARRPQGNPSRGGRSSGGAAQRRGEIDRYNYVDRDIYSSRSAASRGSAGRPSGGNRRKKPRHRGLKRLGAVVLSLVVFLSLGVIAYAGVMLSRMNRQEANTESYVQQPSAAPAWEVVDDDKITNILLLGVDKGDDGLSSRSDTCMLISIDNHTGSLRMVSFLRDLYIEIPTVGKARLNTAYTHGGAALTMQTLENNFRIAVDKYIEIDFEGLTSIIDQIGGIDIEVSAAAAQEENQMMGSNLKEGMNHLNGELALYYARIRHIDSDFGRTARQQQVLQAIMDRCKGKNPAELSALAYDFLPHVTTNLTNSDLLYLISLAPQILDGYEIETAHIPADNAFQDLTLPSGAMVLDPDLEENCRILREFLHYETDSAGSAEE